MYELVAELIAVAPSRENRNGAEPFNIVMVMVPLFTPEQEVGVKAVVAVNAVPEPTMDVTVPVQLLASRMVIMYCPEVRLLKTFPG